MVILVILLKKAFFGYTSILYLVDKVLENVSKLLVRNIGSMSKSILIEDEI